MQACLPDPIPICFFGVQGIGHLPHAGLKWSKYISRVDNFSQGCQDLWHLLDPGSLRIALVGEYLR